MKTPLQHDMFGDALAPWRSPKALTEIVNAGADTPTFSQHSIRFWLANRHRNGLDKFVRKVGKKVLISEPGFWLWVESRQ